jgi:hypothetical protein
MLIPLLARPGILLAGDGASDDQRFDVPPSGQKVSDAKPPAKKAIFVGGISADMRNPATITVVFRPYDPRSGDWRSERIGGAERILVRKSGQSTAGDIMKYGKDRDFTPVAYHVVEADPGSYEYYGMTAFHGRYPGDIHVSEDMVRTRDARPGNSGRHQFTLRPGDIVYYGTFHVFSGPRPVLIKFTREEDAARAALLKEFPGLPADVAFSELP